jgi:CheY-like chemotaxis protein
VLGDVERLFLPRAREKGLRLEVQLAPGLSLLRKGDALRLRQVLFNLVSNGLKFTERGRVTVSVSAGEGNEVRFGVEDTGIGISPAVLPKLFAMFEQGDASTTRRFGGTGLGLALARPLVTLMGGQLRVESAEGVGSRFFFAVPLEAGAPLLAATPPHPTPVAQAHRVLVVDDNAINLKVAVSLLGKAGYRAQAVTSGAEAVVAASHTRFLAVLMDCHMPGMDGFEATRRIRSLPAPFGSVPIVALTASTSGEDLTACRQSGMRAVLIKPVSIKALVGALDPLRPDPSSPGT